MRRYYWDFFGPLAEGTARHFLEHLDEFLEREGLKGCTTGVEEDEGDFAAFCDTHADNRAIIERALRPKRYLEL